MSKHDDETRVMPPADEPAPQQTSAEEKRARIEAHKQQVRRATGSSDRAARTYSSNGSGHKEKKARNNKQMTLIIVIIVVAAIVLFGGGAYLLSQVLTGKIKSADSYETMTISSTNYTSTVSAVGTVESVDTLAVSPEVDGTIKKVSVKNGSKVQKGDTLFTIENSSLITDESTAKIAYTKAASATSNANTTLAGAKKKLVTAQSTLKTVEKEIDDARKTDPTYERDTTSFEQAVADAKEVVADAETTVATAKENEATAKKDYDKAVKERAKLTVRAKKSGTVTDLTVEKGMSTAAVNAQGVALRIVDLSKLVGNINIPESDVKSVRKGQDVTITSDSLSGKSVPGTISSVSDTPLDAAVSKDNAGTDDSSAKTATGTVYPVTVTLGSSAKNLKLGMSINVTINIRDYGTVFYIPESAVATDTLGSHVVVVGDDQATTQHDVSVLDHTDDGQAIVQSSSLSNGQVIRVKADE